MFSWIGVWIGLQIIILLEWFLIKIKWEKLIQARTHEYHQIFESRSVH